jgi:tRNA (guanine-N7-)-methyltransferase
MTETIITPDAVPKRRLYGRRRGRALRTGQRALVDTLLPQLSVTLPSDGRLDPRSLFQATVEDCWLEIGFGAGEHLAFQAASHPQIGLIGCEVFEPGIARFLTDIANQNLGNLRLFADDARLLISALTPQSLGRAFILFPDPWPKERHKKRRIVSTETLDDLAVAMRPGAELRLGTDVPDYAEWMAERGDAHPAFERVAFTDRPADWPATRYEMKAQRQGRGAALFRYRRR